MRPRFETDADLRKQIDLRKPSFSSCILKPSDWTDMTIITTSGTSICEHRLYAIRL
jgi:hypothetical protein